MIKILDELLRKEIVAVSKNETPSRYRNRFQVRFLRLHGVDLDALDRDGTLRVYLIVLGSTRKRYRVTISISNFMSVLRNHLVSKKVYKAVRDAIVDCLNHSDIQVHCTCPDFLYRFEYTSNKKGILASPPGNPTIEPALITNPDNKGTVCKHLTFILNHYARWSPKIAPIIVKYYNKNYR